MGAKSKRSRKIDALTAITPRLDALALARIAKKDTEPVYDTAGTDTGTRRRSNVFRILRQAETITANQSAAGARLVEIYAAWKGLAGAPDSVDVGYVQQSRPEPELVTDRMLSAGREWKAIMSYVGPSSSRLLLALCQDIVEGDGYFLLLEKKEGAPKWKGAPRVTEHRQIGPRLGKIARQPIDAHSPSKGPKVRWRHVVETLTGETARDRQSVHVARACADLEAYWR